MAEEALSANLSVPGSVPSPVLPETVQSEMGRESGAVTAEPHLDPERIRAALAAAGFDHVGQRTGFYTRWCWPGTGMRSPSIVVPENAEAGDYQLLIDELIADLAYAVEKGARAKQVLTALAEPDVSADQEG